MSGKINERHMYICQFKSKGKWDVRKVTKSDIKTEATYSIETEFDKDTGEGVANCECQGFTHNGHCKHIEMVGGKLAPFEGVSHIADSEVEQATAFLKGYCEDLFGVEAFVQFVPEEDGIGERFDVLVKDDEQQLMWTVITVPFDDGSRTSKTAVRVIMSTDTETDKKILTGEVIEEDDSSDGEE